MPYRAEPRIDPVWRGNTLRQAEAWIQTCLKHDDHCRYREYGKPLPTRVIDVGPSDGSKPPSLYAPKESHVSEDSEVRAAEAPMNRESWRAFRKGEGSWAASRYVALSYCWGDTQNFVTTRETIESMEAGIHWEDIPQTVRGAISLTRGLGIRYLWVDALCIIQDSPEDWEIESVKMADIYGGAFLTISAAHGPDVHSGLPRQVDAPKQNFPLQGDRLYSRAWALQERVLSNRVLIFGSDQLYWECHYTTMSYSLGWPVPSPVTLNISWYIGSALPILNLARLALLFVTADIHMDSNQCGANVCISKVGEDGKKIPHLVSHRMPLEPSHDDWERMVQDYSSRSLTYEMDKMPALSGLAEVYRLATNHTYLFGLWRETLLLSLLWKEQWLVYGNRIDPSLPTKYRAPSWSWASIDGNIRFTTFGNREVVMSAELVGTCIDPSPDVPWPPIGDWICLRGPLLAGEIKDDKVVLLGGGTVAHWIDVPQDDEELPNYWADSFPLEGVSGNKEVWSLLIATTYEKESKDIYEGHGLILSRNGTAGDNVFRRIGYFITAMAKLDAPIWKSRFEECDHSTFFIV